MSCAPYIPLFAISFMPGTGTRRAPEVLACLEREMACGAIPVKALFILSLRTILADLLCARIGLVAIVLPDFTSLCYNARTSSLIRKGSFALDTTSQPDLGGKTRED